MSKRAAVITLFGILGISASKNIIDGSKNEEYWGKNSKVKDGNGNLLTLYHGSPIKDISTFSTKNIGSSSGSMGHYGYGIYFTDSLLTAKNYGEYVYKVHLNIKNPFIPSVENYKKLMEVADIPQLKEQYQTLSYNTSSFINELIRTGRIHSAMLIQKMVDENMDQYSVWDYILEQDDLIPLVQSQLNTSMNMFIHTYLNYLDHFSTNQRHILNNIEHYQEWCESLGIDPEENMGFRNFVAMHWITALGAKSMYITQKIKELGFDGIIANNGFEKEWVAFYPEQIKILEIVNE